MTGRRRHSGRVLLRPFLFVVVAIACGVVPATAVLGAAAPSVSIRLFHGAAVHYPVGIAAGADGALWFTNEEGHSIGRISVQGTLGEYTDPRIAAPSAIASGPDGALWFLNGGGSFGRITTAGVVTTYTTDAIASTVGLAAGPDGAMWFTTGAKSVGRLAMDGTVTTFVDPARMRGTYGIVAGPDGALWFTNYLGGSIGRISVDGVVTEYSDPRIRFPLGITAGPDGALWFADDSGSIGRITTTGAVSTFGDSSTVGHPFAITVGPDRALWVTERGGSIVRITTSGAISRYADPSVQVPVGIASGPGGAPVVHRLHGQRDRSCCAAETCATVDGRSEHRRPLPRARDGACPRACRQRRPADAHRARPAYGTLPPARSGKQGCGDRSQTACDGGPGRSFGSAVVHRRSGAVHRAPDARPCVRARARGRRHSG